MKLKKLEVKLSLKKATIATLNNPTLDNVRGGTVQTAVYPHCSNDPRDPCWTTAVYICKTEANTYCVNSQCDGKTGTIDINPTVP